MTQKLFEGLHAPTIIALCAILASFFLLVNFSVASVKANQVRFEKDIRDLKAGQVRLEGMIKELLRDRK